MVKGSEVTAEDMVYHGSQEEIGDNKD